LWGVFSTADQAIAIVEQGITAPADGELVLVDARGWQGGQRSADSNTDQHKTCRTKLRQLLWPARGCWPVLARQ
jgi:hypothetical protein